jgi:tetratricopeptide (TPR) repeat protein
MAHTLSLESSARPSNRWLYAGTAVLLVLSIAVEIVRDRGWQPYQPTTPIMWFHSGPLLKRVALGFDNLLADVYWMRAVIYYGSKRRSAEQGRNFDLLDPMLTFVTTLDPQFKVAYRFGAIFLTEGSPLGPGRPDLAIALLERGIAANPNAWEYPHDIGFVNYWWLHDYRTAAEWFAKAAKRPGAAEWLAALAASTLAQGGDRQSSRFLWRKLLESNDADWLKQNAERSLAQLDAMDLLDELNRASQRYTAREGRPPQTWKDLVIGERLRGIPLDQTGTPFVLDPATGHIDLSRKSTLWPLPTNQAGPKRGVK